MFAVRPRSMNAAGLRGFRRVIVGVPKETKRDEYRVAILPVGVEEMVRAGHQVLVETGGRTGLGAYVDQVYESSSGASLVAIAAAAEIFFSEAEA